MMGSMMWLAAVLVLLLIVATAEAGRRGFVPSASARDDGFIPLGRLPLGGGTPDLSACRHVRASSLSEILISDRGMEFQPVVNTASSRRVKRQQPTMEGTLLASSSTTTTAATSAPAPTKRGLCKFLPFRCCKRRKEVAKLRSNADESTALPPSSEVMDKAKLAVGAAQPLIPQDVWDNLSGDEYDDPRVVDALAKTGLMMATKHTNNGWVDWKGSIAADLDSTLDKGEILVFTGSTVKPGYGSEVPWIKSLSMIPMAPAELADLMMDSSRVKTYNSLSMGRDDIKVMPSNSESSGATKIVRNVVQLPVSNSKVESVTLLHTRQLDNGSHLLISRAVGGTKYFTGVGKSYILLGVNLFEPTTSDPNECRMTAINHVYSPGVPLMLAGKVGVKSAKNFVKDIRALCVPVA